MFALGLLRKRIFDSNHSFKFSTSSNPNFTVEYLITSCGFSESAANATKNPEPVLNLFTSYAFTKPQISTILTKIPQILLSNPEKTLKPKIEFLKSSGISDVGELLAKNPKILKSSLDNQIIPSFEFLRAILPTNHDVLRSFRRSTWVLSTPNRHIMMSNMSVLRDLGVSESNIIFLLKRPRSLLRSPIGFKKDIYRLLEIGFDPLRHVFVEAVFRFTGLKDSTWERKFEVYRRWGWSDRDILLAFKRRPDILMASEKKIHKVMDFVINKMGWDSSEILRYPAVFASCLKIRIIPRLLVVQFLVSKGLVEKKNVKLSGVLSIREDQFLDKFVNKHKGYVSELLSLYEMNRNCRDLQNDTEILQ